MDYTRVTVHGTTRRSDLVLPQDEPLVELMPGLLELLEEDPTRAGFQRLSTLDGVQLDPERSLADQQVADGTLLHLVSLDQAPPPPELSDVTEAVVAERERRRDVWSQDWARVAATGTAGVLGFLAARLAVPERAGLVSWGVVAPIVALALLGRRRAAWPVPGLMALVLGATIAVGRYQAVHLLHLTGHDTVRGVLGATCLGLAALALMAGWGARRRPVLAGAAVGAVAAALPLALQLLGTGFEHAHAIAAVVDTLVVGLLPGWAMALSGLNGLDDQIVGGRRTRRDGAEVVARSAFATLGWLAVGVCLPLAVSLVVLAAAPGRWMLALCVAVAVTLGCRARFFPLAEQVAALWGVVALLGVRLVAGWVWRPMSRAGLLAGAALVVVLVLSGRPADHTRARLRTWLNLLEQFAVLALVPVLLGAFGVYGDLLQAFRR